MSALTTTCESRTVSGSKSVSVDFVIGKLAVEENLYDKTWKRTSANNAPHIQTKVNLHTILYSNFYTS